MAQLSERKKDVEGRFMQDFWATRKAIGTPPRIDINTASQAEIDAESQYWAYVLKCVEGLTVKYKALDPEDNGYYDSLILDCVNDLELRCRSNNRAAADGMFALSTLNILRKIRGLPPVGVLNEQS